jgi:transcriptional regulator with XRE-family HTH domain
MRASAALHPIPMAPTWSPADIARAAQRAAPLPDRRRLARAAGAEPAPQAAVEEARLLPHDGDGPDPIDVHVGQRIRERRRALGLSQQTLAAALGLSYQQLQKVELGRNRIAAARLRRLSDILECPVSLFFEDLPGRRRADAAPDDALALARAIRALSPVVRDKIGAFVGELALAGDAAAARPASRRRRNPPAPLPTVDPLPPRVSTTPQPPEASDVLDADGRAFLERALLSRLDDDLEKLLRRKLPRAVRATIAGFAAALDSTGAPDPAEASDRAPATP